MIFHYICSCFGGGIGAGGSAQKKEEKKWGAKNKQQQAREKVDAEKEVKQRELDKATKQAEKAAKFKQGGETLREKKLRGTEKKKAESMATLKSRREEEREERERKGKAKKDDDDDEEEELVELKKIPYTNIIKINLDLSLDHMDITTFINEIRTCCVREGYEVHMSYNDSKGKPQTRWVKFTCPMSASFPFALLVFAARVREAGDIDRDVSITALMRRADMYISALAKTDAGLCLDYQDPGVWYVLKGAKLRFVGSTKNKPQESRIGISYTKSDGAVIDGNKSKSFECVIGVYALKKQLADFHDEDIPFHELQFSFRNILAQCVESARSNAIFKFVTTYWKVAPYFHAMPDHIYKNVWSWEKNSKMVVELINDRGTGDKVDVYTGLGSVLYSLPVPPPLYREINEKNAKK